MPPESRNRFMAKLQREAGFSVPAVSPEKKLNREEDIPF